LLRLDSIEKKKSSALECLPLTGKARLSQQAQVISTPLRAAS